MSIVRGKFSGMVSNLFESKGFDQIGQRRNGIGATIFLLACAMAAVLVPTQHVQAQSGYASAIGTPGAFSVSKSGAGVYRIPIQAPPGVANMVPKLELAYSSQHGNGMVGLGWGISGLSSITRCAMTKAQDGALGSINFDANDKFCLDGQRLMLFSGTYGAPGSEYRTEIDSFSRITANGTVGSGPVSFTVKTKAGLTIEYGNTPDSRIEALKASSSAATWGAGTVRAWAQNKVTDLSGNFMTVTYDEDTANGAYYPSRIDYTGNTSTSPALATSASLQFTTDTSRLDALLGYQAGAQFKSIKRINAIRAYVGSALTREYRLAYSAQSSALDRSKLSSVTECDGASNCLAPILLTWGANGLDTFAAATGLTGQFSTAQGWTDNSTFPRFIADVNGDGLPDIVGFSSSGVYVATNNGNGFNAPSFWLSGQYGTTQGWTDNSSYPRFLIDVNGDGLPDIVGFASNGVYVAINTGTGFNTPTYWLSGQFGTAQGYANNNVNPRYLVDVDGDGRPDIVAFANDGVYIATNNGNGFNMPVLKLASQFGVNQGWSKNSVNPRYLMDINGDGLPDIVGFAGTGVTVAVNTGGSFSLASSLPANYGCPATATVSGSNCITTSAATPNYVCTGSSAGLTLTFDSESGTYICYRSTSTSSQLGPATLSYYSCAVGSLSGSSCLITSSAGYSCPTGYTLPSVGSSTCTNGAGAAAWNLAQFGVAQGWSDTNLAPRYLVDVNGDGLPDIVGFSDGGVTVAINTGSGFSPPTSIAGTYSCSTGTLSGSSCIGSVAGTPNYTCSGTGYSTFSMDLESGPICFNPSHTSTFVRAIISYYSCPSGYSWTGSNCIVATPAAYTYTTADSLSGTNWALRQFGVAQGWKDNNTNPRQLVDVNGDGLPDIVGFGPNGVMVSINNGAGFNAPLSWSTNFGSAAADWADNTTKPRFVIDVNGDGLPDIVGFGGSGVSLAFDGRTMASNFVASITNSTGAVTTPTFSALTATTSSGLYTKDIGTNAASFPKVDVVAPFYVVSSVARSNGVGGTNTTSYNYGGLKAEQGTGRGMLGFRWFKSREPTPVGSSLIERYNEFRQDWPFVGMPNSDETRLVNSGTVSLLKQKKVSVSCLGTNGTLCSVAPLGIYFPYVSATVESSWDSNGAVLPVTKTAYSFGQSPQFGDPTLVTVETNDGFSSTTVNAYFAADTVNWIAPRLQKTTLTNSKP